MSAQSPAFLETGNGQRVAYHRFTPKNASNEVVTVIFLGGFKSDMNGTKAVFLESLCIENNIPFIRFDYFGHGESSGDFLDGSIGQWKQDAVNVIDQLVQTEKCLLVGSSLGGWIALLATIARPKKVAGMLGIAAAPDFTDDLIWDIIKESERQQIMEQGQYALPNEYCDDPEADPEPYIITKLLIEEARNHMLLKGGAIDIHCPVRLIHGMEDADVPYEYAMKLCKKIASDDVEVHYIKNGDHRMSSAYALDVIQESLLKILQQISKKA